MAWTILGVVTAGFAAVVASFFLWWKSKTHSIMRDMISLYRTIKAVRWLKAKQAAKWTVADMWEQHAYTMGAPSRKVLTWIKPDGSGDVIYTAKQIESTANKVANWAHSAGIRQGTPVALLMENGPNFVFFLLGLSKIGAEIAMINTNLKGKQLRHCLSISKAKTFIVSHELSPHVTGLVSEFDAKWFVHGNGDQKLEGFESLEPLLEKASEERPSKSLRDQRTTLDPAFYIYTSGTTGMPKASKVKALRFFTAGCGFCSILDIKKTDVIYCTLPLYHSAAGLIGLGTAMFSGGNLVLRKKFSASNFFKDCGKYNVTIIQYIGELCRYLLATEPSEHDGNHNTLVAKDLPIRPDIWVEFKKRFRIGHIAEFYAATESPVGYLNLFNVDKCVGYRSDFLELLYHAGRFMKYDVENQKLVRDSSGLCVPCKPGEVGEVLGVIQEGNPLKEFGGYLSKEATKKKIIHDVEKKGDVFFRTGDLLKYDKYGNVFFVDRLGDTFRWKGENVATNEVGEIITNHAGIAEAAVYGVQIGTREGRAGMAALVVEKDVETAMKGFYAFCAAEMPLYACPLFLRIVDSLEKTSTYKYRKVTMQREGFDPSSVSDPLYFRDDAKKAFVRLDSALCEDIVSGKVRV